MRTRLLARGEGPALAGLTALVALLFPSVVFRGEVFYERDVHLVWYSQVESFVRAVRGGSWPVWDPYVSFGHPMLANSNTQVLYPPTWINLLLSPETAYVVLTLAHLAWAGFGLLRLARRLGLSPGASAVASAAWIASGPLLSLVNVWHHLAGASWIPWVFLAAEDALASPSIRSAALWGGAVGVQLLAGSPDMSAFTGAAIVVFTLTRLEWHHPLGAPNRRRLAAAILAVLFALGLAAAQILPSLETAHRSLRWNTGPALRGYVGSLHPLGALAKVLSPIPLGDLPLNPAGERAFLDGGLPLLRSLYLGAAALALGLAAFGGEPPAGRRYRTFFASLGAAAALFALGHHTWAYPALVALFPPLRSLRYPSKAMVFAALAWAILTGLGFERWRRREVPPTPKWTLGVTVPLAAVTLLLAAGWHAVRNPPGLLAPYLWPELTPGRSWREALAVWVVPLAAATVLAALTLAATLARRRPEATAGAVAVLAIADLVLAGGKVNHTTSRQFYRYRPSLVDAVDQRDLSRLFVASYWESEREGLPVENPYKIAWYPEGIDFHAGLALGTRLALMPPVGAAWGIFASWQPDLLRLYPDHLAALLTAVHEAEGTPGWRRWMELGAVRYVAVLEDHGLSDLTFVRDLPTPLVLPLRLYRLDDPLPRTYVVGGGRVADGDAARRILQDPAFDPRREVVLADGSALNPPPDFAGASRVLDLRADRVRLEATASGPGFLVLVDAFDPGWKATLDGRTVPIVRANGSFRAVPVPAGRHLVELIYRPGSVVAGLLVSTVTLVVGLVLIVPRGENRPRGGPRQPGSPGSPEAGRPRSPPLSSNEERTVHGLRDAAEYFFKLLAFRRQLSRERH